MPRFCRRDVLLPGSASTDAPALSRPARYNFLSIGCARRVTAGQGVPGSD